MGVLPRNTGGGGGTVGVEMLSERAAMMRESVQKSQSITDNMVSMLGSFDHRLSALESAMRPTQVKKTFCFSNLYTLLFSIEDPKFLNWI